MYKVLQTLSLCNKLSNVRILKTNSLGNKSSRVQGLTDTTAMSNKSSSVNVLQTKLNLGVTNITGKEQL